ncbi:MAG TPA: phosphatase domain-containing protein [Bdellovibrio sp.]|uniref:phosphatase domain-containing protein n=1 Tax=Bdellovibrio sp. TaxID=28201 RepID=UPI002EDE599B
MKSLFILLFIFVGAIAQAKVVLVSDIDDTLKIANVQDLDSAAVYAFDDQSRFLGMSELLTLLKSDHPDMSIYYLSKAPQWLMGSTHLSFLHNGGFPAGLYIPRTDLSAETHKLIHLRAILEAERPDTVILIGDNGEQDSANYEQIKSEYPNIRFYQYIHLIYASHGREEVGSVPFMDQVGYATAAELSLDLARAELLSQASTAWMMTNIASAIVKQPLDLKTGEVAFPRYMRCNELVWRWDDLDAFPNFYELKEKVIRRCQKK